MLDERAVAAGYRHLAFDTLGSTNDEALSRARAGDPGKLWIVAGSQSQGRGRVGRSWSSPVGNLYASLLLVDPAEPRFAAELGFVAGLALARAVNRVAGRPDEVRIKWPNDLVRHGAKLAGVLVEGTQLPGGAFACVLGFGVNCASHPSGLPYEATHIESFVAASGTSAQVFEALSVSVVEMLSLWKGGREFCAIRDGWLSLALPRGSALTVKTASSTIDGCFETIDDRGRLVLNTAWGPTTIDAADVFLRDRATAEGETR